MKRGFLLVAALLGIVLAPTFAQAGWWHHWGHHCCHWNSYAPAGQYVMVGQAQGQVQGQFNQQGAQELNFIEAVNFAKLFVAALDRVNFGNAGNTGVVNRDVDLTDYLKMAEARQLFVTKNEFEDLVTKVATLENELKSLPKKADLDALEARLTDAIKKIKP